jgi:hypothetical protein
VVATVEPPGDEDHEAETDEAGSEREAPAAHDGGDSSDRGVIPVTHR